ncbi:MAG: hypothetical protein ACOX6V_03445 [Patescibacteria group bacterium]|jgi:hypothetical protein
MKHKYITKQNLGVLIALSLFAVTVAIFNWKGYTDTASKQIKLNTEKEPAKREDTEVSVSDVNISGQIMFVKDKKLFVLDPESNEVTELVSKPIVEHPGVLEDGRVYFWQEEAGVYSRLYLQKGKIFERFHIPIEPKDGSLGVGTPPIVASSGKFVIFASDREAVDNYYRRALYKYDLEKLELSKLTDNTVMTVYEIFISPSTDYIGFTFQNIESSKGASPKALGIVVTETKTVNLYPKIQVNNVSIAFSSDNKLIYLTAQQGPAVFDLSKGKITDSLDGGVLRGASPDGVLAIEEEIDSSNLTFIESCGLEDSREFIQNNTLVFVAYEDGELGEVSRVKSDEYAAVFPLNRSQYLFSPDSSEVLIIYRDKDHCEPVTGILNLTTKSITPLDVIGNAPAFWLGGE